MCTAYEKALVLRAVFGTIICKIMAIVLLLSSFDSFVWRLTNFDCYSHDPRWQYQQLTNVTISIAILGLLFFGYLDCYSTIDGASLLPS